ncbi:MAG: hypothetical protein ACYC0J_09385, partial [Gammaproteobacteria bacterium]
MKTFKLAAITACAISICSTAAFADNIHLQNDTNTYMTASAGLSPCSSAAGDSGKIKPGESLDVPSVALTTFCMFGCDASIYASKSCSGKKIALVKINKNQTIGAVTNTNGSGYVITAAGNTVTATGTGRLKSLF